MKTLILVRHAKSSWDHPHLTDFERPLNKRGKNDAPLMGKVLAGKGIVADQIISSGANRALTTAQIIAAEISFRQKNIEITKALYHASAEEIIALAATANDNTTILLLFGHNPGMTNAANNTSNARLDNLPTTGIFAVDFEIESWAQIIGKKGSLNFYEFPKLHK